MIRMTAFVVLVLLVTASFADAEVKREQMLYPTVQLSSDKGSGTGVVIESSDTETLILTAAHVTEIGNLRALFVGEKTGKSYPVTLVDINKAFDIALVSIPVGGKKVGKISPLNEIGRMEQVFSVGSGKGYPIHLTEGYTSISNGGYMLVTTPAISGNSGGGIWIKRGDWYELVGIASQQPQTPAKIHDADTFLVNEDLVAIVPVYHLLIVVNIDTIHKFLAGTLVAPRKGY